MVSGELKKAVVREDDITSQTVVEEHVYQEFITNFWRYDNSHYDRYGKTSHDYEDSNTKFFVYLTQR